MSDRTSRRVMLTKRQAVLLRYETTKQNLLRGKNNIWGCLNFSSCHDTVCICPETGPSTCVATRTRDPLCSPLYSTVRMKIGMFVFLLPAVEERHDPTILEQYE